MLGELIEQLRFCVDRVGRILATSSEFRDIRSRNKQDSTGARADDADKPELEPGKDMVLWS